MFPKYKLVFICIFFLTFTNIFLIFSYIMSKFIKCESENSSSYYLNQLDTKVSSSNGQQIQFNFDIMDIYRIDISCDYIVKDLYQQISRVYRNTKKKCSLSSLNPSVNKMVSESLNDDYDSSSYKPIVDAKIEFDPFRKTNSFNNSLVTDILSDVKPGGEWEPLVSLNKACSLNDIDEIAFIVPYSKQRYENLKYFLLNIHSYLKRVHYKFKYRIIVVEQEFTSKSTTLFNKGRLINTAFKFVLDNYKNIDCIIIHDVDIIPSNESSILKDMGDYRCHQMPWHLSLSVFHLSNNATTDYNRFLTGGILSLRPQHFIVANGFSNRYFGWGAEDDDWTVRMFNKKLCIMRPERNASIVPYLMLTHPKSKANNDRYKLLSTSLMFQNTDGLSNINSLTNIVNVTYYPAFTHLLVNVGF